MFKRRPSKEFQALTQSTLPEDVAIDPRRWMLRELLVNERWDSVTELCLEEQLEWAAFLDPPRADGTVALLTVRSQLVGGTPPGTIAKRAALLYDRLLIQPGALIGAGPPFARVDINVEVVEPLSQLGADWFDTFSVPPRWGSVGGHALERYLGFPNGEVPGSIWSDPKWPWMSECDGKWAYVMGEHTKYRQVAEHLLYGDWFGASLVTSDELLAPFALSEQLSGRALRLVVPDFESLSWEQIATFREHPGSREARGRFREWESEAAAEADDARTDRTAALVVKDLLSAIHESRPRVGQSLGKEVVMTATELVPGAGFVVAKAVAIEEAARESRAYRRSWKSALAELSAIEPSAPPE